MLRIVVLSVVALVMMMLRSTFAFGFRTLRTGAAPSTTNFQRQRNQNIHRAFYHYGRLSLSLAYSKGPSVEVSPSDHGTSPLSDFISSTVLDRRLIKSLQSPSMNITTPTPIQSHAMPLLFNSYDVMASSATGSGKTLMFGLPLMNHLLTVVNKGPNKSNSMGLPRGLIISPTRELALQTAGVLNSLKTNINVCLATGGSDSRNQRQSLPRSNVLVGTPGRICQFLDERKLSLQSVDYLVIDEADRLLDMGFEKDLTRIARSFSKNNDRQSILCSATFPLGVQRLAADFLDANYYFVSVGRVGSTHSTIKQRFEWVDIYGGRNTNNRNPKVDLVVKNVKTFWASNPKKDQSSVIVFTNTKDGAELIGKSISNKLGNSRAVRVIHGDKPQSERNRAMQDFKAGKVSLLVATDVAARGLDVSHVGLVIQAEAPRSIDDYTHRIGRTGRAGRSGEALTLLDSKSGFGLASGLVDLLEDAGQSNYVPSWLRGQAHIARARSMEEDMKIQAGSLGIQSDGGSSQSASDLTNEEFSHQDFRRTASKDSYGIGKDTAYRSFEEEAYSSDLDLEEVQQNATATSSFESADTGDMADVTGVTSEASFDSRASFESRKSEASFDPGASFERRQPSPELIRAISDISGKSEIGDTPEQSVLNSLGRRNQKLRFEYLGLFPFHLVSPLLMTSTSNNANNDKVKVLMVAEKPSIAKSIADALSGKRGPVQRRGISRALPVYEFTTDKFLPINGEQCLVRVTSVVGHIYSLGFDYDPQNKDQRNDPRDYFTMPVTKKEESTTSKLRVVDHLRALAGDSDHLVLWLDCDPEGENIAHEVMAVTRRAIHSNVLPATENEKRIHRAKFSAITSKAIQDAFLALEEPDPLLSRSVDARQELDLRIGVALTRLLTWRCVNIARKRYSASTRMISYGPCQTPALSFCVDRLHEIEEFQPTKYWKVHVEAKLSDGKSYPLSWKIPSEEAVEDTRNKHRGNEDCATFDQQSAKHVVERAGNSDMNIIVTSLTKSSDSLSPPVGLNTVALLEAGSKAMGMSPKQVMNVAEKLYSAGFISYPRTETTRYDPNGFDARSMLREHSNHPDWGRSASYLLRTRKSGKPPLRGKDAGDHPPITPLKSATREEVGGGAAWRVYDFIVRNFLGSLHSDLLFTRTIASLALPDGNEAEFELEIVTVDSLGFADCCRWVLRDIGATPTDRQGNKNLMHEGQSLQLTKANIEERATRPPTFLQEHELIRLMDSNRIGTDASMAVHVSNIVDRGYVMLCDETGVPLRPPLPPGRRKQNLPRQIGRYMIPTPLGASLLELFDHNSMVSDVESPAMLSHPQIRRQMEEEVKEICLGNIEKEYCLEKNLDWFERRYLELEESLTRDRVGEFGKNLRSNNDYLRYLQKLGAFEPKVAMPNKQQQKGKTNNNKKRQSYTAKHKSRKGQNAKRRSRVKQA